MTNLFEQFATDQKSEAEGVWIVYGTNSKGNPLRVLLARAGGQNKAYTKALEVAMRPHRTAIQNQTIDEEVAATIFRDVFSKHVVLNWEGVEDATNQDIPYSPENAAFLLKELPEFYNDLKKQAGDISIFKKTIQADSLKN